MKKVLSLTAMLLMLVAAQAQLAQTKWKGRMLVPNETEGWLNFKKDTLEVFVSNGDVLLETMSYAIAQDTLLIQKVSGRSSCDASTIGKYRWSVKGDSLSVTLLSDDCDARYKTWSGKPYVRKKDEGTRINAILSNQ